MQENAKRHTRMRGLMRAGERVSVCRRDRITNEPRQAPEMVEKYRAARSGGVVMLVVGRYSDHNHGEVTGAEPSSKPMRHIPPKPSVQPKRGSFIGD